jgi:hypothetical protein
MSRYFKKAYWYNFKRQFNRARYAQLIRETRRHRDAARLHGLNDCADLYVFRTKCLVTEAKVHGL